MRLRVRDQYSTQAGGNRIDEFRVIITYICNRDEITIATQVPDQVYLFSAPSQAITPTTFNRSIAGCQTSYKLEIYSVAKFTWEFFDSAKHGYFISNWNAATGTATISNAGLNGAVSLKPTTSY